MKRAGEERGPALARTRRSCTGSGAVAFSAPTIRAFERPTGPGRSSRRGESRASTAVPSPPARRRRTRTAAASAEGRRRRARAPGRFGWSRPASMLPQHGRRLPTATQTLARKSEPAGSSSVTTSSPEGRRSRPPIRSRRRRRARRVADRGHQARVARNRLSRICCLCAGVQRPPAIDSPARLTTASAPSIWFAQAPTSPSGVQPRLHARAGSMAAPRRENDDLVPFGSESRGERRAEKARAAGNDDLHGPRV